MTRVLVALLVVPFALVSHAQVESFVINHNSIALFDQMTPSVENEARAIRMAFVNRSVGSNVNDGLKACLAVDPASAPSHCQGQESWTRAYPSPNWVFYGWPLAGMPNQVACNGFGSSWRGYQACFLSWASSQIGQKDIISFWFDYFSGMSASPPLVDYFTYNATQQDITDFEAFFDATPQLRPWYWTTSLPRTDGGMTGMVARLDAFNVALRAYVQQHGGTLIDAADILSHGLNGSQSTYQGSPNIHSDYTTETNGGHLNGTGKVRMAKAIWVAMAHESGWIGEGGSNQSPTVTITCQFSNGRVFCEAIPVDDVGVVDATVTITVRDTGGLSGAASVTVVP